MNVLLAVQSADLRLGLDLIFKEQPEVTVMGATSSTEELLILLHTVELDLVIMQWELPGLPAAEVLAEARTLPHPPRFLVLGRRSEDETSAVSAGADVFVLVGDRPHLLFNAIDSLRPCARTE